MDLDHEDVRTADLFGDSNRIEKVQAVLQAVDSIDAKFGKHTVFLGSSWKAVNSQSHRGDRGEETERRAQLLRGETKRQRIGLPFLGKIDR